MQDEKIEDLIDNVILCLQQLSAPTRFYGAHRQSVSPFDEPSFAGRHTFQVEYSSVVSHDYRDIGGAANILSRFCYGELSKVDAPYPFFFRPHSKVSQSVALRSLYGTE
jgi:hypothetical protein